jgi:hypothetical protein
MIDEELWEIITKIEREQKEKCSTQQTTYNLESRGYGKGLFFALELLWDYRRKVETSLDKNNSED